MSEAGHRHQNQPTTSNFSWQKHEIPSIIDKPLVEKQKENAIFPDGFRRINHS